MLTLIGATLIFTAIFMGWWNSRKKTDMPVKVMSFVLYFWGTVFAGLIVFAVLFQLGWLDWS